MTASAPDHTSEAELARLRAFWDAMHTVAITRRHRRHGNRDVFAFQAYCRRCQEHVPGSGNQLRNYVWATKPPAVRAAKAHLDGHARYENWLSRQGLDFTIVETVTL